MTCYIALVGAPSTGKTAVLRELEKRGYAVIEEASRQFIENQRKVGGKLLPDVDRDAFQKALLGIQIGQREEKEKEKLVFCDTSIPCGIAYYEADGLEAPAELWDAAQAHKYDIVLIMEPLPFYEEDGLRIENREKALVIQQKLKEVNARLGNEIVDVPFMRIDERVEFIEGVVKERMKAMLS